MKLDKKQIIFIIVGAIASGIVGYLIWRVEQKQNAATTAANDAAQQATDDQQEYQQEQDNQLLATLSQGYAGSVSPQYENTTAGYDEDQGETTAAPDPVTDLLDQLFPGGSNNGITQIDAGENLSQASITDTAPTPTIQLSTSPLGANTTSPSSQIPTGNAPSSTVIIPDPSTTEDNDPTLANPGNNIRITGGPVAAI